MKLNVLILIRLSIHLARTKSAVVWGNPTSISKKSTTKSAYTISSHRAFNDRTSNVNFLMDDFSKPHIRLPNEQLLEQVPVHLTPPQNLYGVTNYPMKNRSIRRIKAINKQTLEESSVQTKTRELKTGLLSSWSTRVAAENPLLMKKTPTSSLDETGTSTLQPSSIESLRSRFNEFDGTKLQKQQHPISIPSKKHKHDIDKATSTTTTVGTNCTIININLRSFQVDFHQNVSELNVRLALEDYLSTTFMMMSTRITSTSPKPNVSYSGSEDNVPKNQIKFNHINNNKDDSIEEKAINGTIDMKCAYGTPENSTSSHSYINFINLVGSPDFGSTLSFNVTITYYVFDGSNNCDGAYITDHNDSYADNNVTNYSSNKNDNNSNNPWKLNGWPLSTYFVASSSLLKKFKDSSYGMLLDCNCNATTETAMILGDDTAEIWIAKQILALQDISSLTNALNRYWKNSSMNGIVNNHNDKPTTFFQNVTLTFLNSDDMEKNNNENERFEDIYINWNEDTSYGALHDIDKIIPNETTILDPSASSLIGESSYGLGPAGSSDLLDDVTNINNDDNLSSNDIILLIILTSMSISFFTVALITITLFCCYHHHVHSKHFLKTTTNTLTFNNETRNRIISALGVKGEENYNNLESSEARQKEFSDPSFKHDMNRNEQSLSSQDWYELTLTNSSEYKHGNNTNLDNNDNTKLSNNLSSRCNLRYTSNIGYIVATLFSSTSSLSKNDDDCEDNDSVILFEDIDVERNTIINNKNQQIEETSVDELNNAEYDQLQQLHRLRLLDLISGHSLSSNSYFEDKVENCLIFQNEQEILFDNETIFHTNDLDNHTNT